MRARWVAVAASLVALLAVGIAAAPASASVSMSNRHVAEADSRPVFVIGAPGLSWSDLDRDDLSLPSIESMQQAGAFGSMTVRAVRSRSCAVDGWLTLSAGRRAADVAGPCRVPAAVEGDLVPGWSDYVGAVAGDGYGARPGLLGSAVAAAGACITTVGAGAAIVGADLQGRVPDAEAEVPERIGCALAVVDGGVLPVDAAARDAALVRLDTVVGAVLRAAEASQADVVLAGVGDGDSPVRPRAVLASGPSFAGGELTSPSTRQPGLVQLQDLTATMLARVGVGSEAVTGRVATTVADDRPVADRVADRVGFETRAGTLRSVSPQVTGWLAALFTLWCAVVALLWWRKRGRARSPLPQAVRAAGVVLATVPVATFVANLVPWWRAPAPGLVFAGVLVVVAAVLAAAALVVERRRHLGGLLVVALVTVAVLGGDVLLGSGLQLGSVFGQNPTVGGRFYGFGNTSFALYGLAVLVVVAALAGTRRLGRWGGAAVGLGVLVVALALEALPGLGADFGGPPGLLLGGLLVLAMATGLRLTPVRVVAAVIGAGVLVAGVAVLDWLRPADARTHLGEFVETVVSGEAGEVVGRKLAQNLANLGSPPLVAMALGTLVLAAVAWRTGRRPGGAGAVVLRGAVVLAVVGFAVNDSGLVIPAFVAVVLAPLLVLAGRATPEEPGAG